MRIILFLYTALVLVLVGSCAHMVQRDIEKKQMKELAEYILDTPNLVIKKNK